MAFNTGISRLRLGISSSPEMFSSTVNPSSGAGVSANIGSVYVRTNPAQVWQKTGAAATAWTLVSGSGSSIYRVATNYTSIQAAIDVGEGTVFVPAGEYLLTAELVLPRTTLDGRGAVKLLGAGSQVTFLIATAGFPANSAVITWAAASGASGDPARLWRTWDQYIGHMTIQAAAADGYCIWYERTELAFNPIFEKWTGIIEDVWFTTFNDWQQVGIYIEGNIHDAVFSDLTFNFSSQTAINFDTLAIQVDTSPTGNDALDNWGMYSCHLKGISTTQISGGYGGIFAGRAQFCTFEDILSGRGSLGMPLLNFEGSCGTQVNGLITEGSAESPSVLLDNCGDIVMENFNLGTPTAVTIGATTYPVGNGIELVNGCYGCEIKHWTSWVNKPLWDIDVGVVRVVLDATSKGNIVNITTGGGMFGNENPYAVITDAGENNRIISRNVNTNVFTKRYNQITYEDATIAQALAIGALRP